MATLDKRGKSWSIRWKDSAGKWHRIGINALAGRKILRKGEAQEIFERWQSERNKFAPAVSYTLDELVTRYDRHAAASWTPDTYRTDMARLREFVRWCGERGIATAAQVTPLIIEDFKHARLAIDKPVTVNRYLERIRAFFNTLLNWRLVAESPFAGVGMLKTHATEPRILSDDEIRRLLGLVHGDLADFVTLAIQTGGRESEIARLKWVDVKSDGIHFLKTKSYRPRTIPYAPGVREMLDNRRTNGAVYVFESGRPHEPVSGSAWYSRLRLAYARAQIDGANVHSLRHTFASRLVRAGVNIKVVQTLMGHANIQTTLRYVHLYQGDTEAAMDRLILPDCPPAA